MNLVTPAFRHCTALPHQPISALTRAPSYRLLVNHQPAQRTASRKLVTIRKIKPDPIRKIKPDPIRKIKPGPKTNGIRVKEEACAPIVGKPRQQTSQDTVNRGALFGDNGKPVISPIYLREACKCSQCVDPSTSQREFSFADIPLNINVASSLVDADGNVAITWENDLPGFTSHKSIYTPLQIKQLGPGNRRTTTALWTSNLFKQETLRASFKDFIRDDQVLANVVCLLRRHGLVFIDNVPEEESSVATLGQRLGPLRNTFYGPTWDVRSVPQAKNVAYTSKHLGFHMDLLYMKEPPRYQLLHCLHNTCIGGESRFVDTWKAIEVLIRDHGLDMFKSFLKLKVRYGYANDKQNYSDAKDVVTFHENSSTTVLSEEWYRRMPDRAKVDAIREYHQQYPNLNRIDAVHWSPPFATGLDEEFKYGKAPTKGSIEARISASKAFAEILERDELVFQTKMEPGTCAIFDNLRVAHARNSFDMNSGKRWLRGAYVNAQEVYSREIELAHMIDALNDTTTTDGPEWSKIPLQA